MSFESLPSDVIIYMALAMDLPEILTLCTTSTRFNNVICQDTPTSVFWINRLKQDFNISWNEKISLLNNYNQNTQNIFTPKQLYRSIKDFHNKYRPIFYKVGFLTSVLDVIKDNLMLADYIIDHWDGKMASLSLPAREDCVANLRISLNTSLMNIILCLYDPDLIKYLFMKMTDDKITSVHYYNENAYYGDYNYFLENVISVNAPELYELFLSKVEDDKKVVKHWIKTIARLLYHDNFNPFYIETRKILRKYEIMYDIHLNIT